MDDHAFQQELVLSAVAGGGRTLQEIASRCGGLYPQELQNVLEVLMLGGKVALTPQGYSLIGCEKAAGNIIQFRRPGNGYAELPEPHLHDYDWRFDTATAQRLANIALRESAPEGNILLLGTPSVLVELLYSHEAPHTTLLDRNHSLIEYLSRFHLPSLFRLVQHDLLSGSLWQGDSLADVVLCDPPWYVEHYAAFLAQAAYASRIGARIVVSLLPPNTRPGAVADRWEIMKTAHTLGLHVLSMESGSIRYQTPAFEQASLASTSIEVKKNWRMGDLVTFAKVDQPRLEVVSNTLAYAMSMIVDMHEWAELLLDRYKVKLRGPFHDYSVEPELLSIEEHDTLPTVSRRYKGRESIDLWLWNNRVFAVRGKAAFLAALYVLDGRPLPDALSKVPERHLRAALSLLLQRTGIVDFQMKKVWKVTRHAEKCRPAPYGFEGGTGTA